jgi:hypothetical protein
LTSATAAAGSALEEVIFLERKVLELGLHGGCIDPARLWKISSVVEAGRFSYCPVLVYSPGARAGVLNVRKAAILSQQPAPA